MTIDVVVELAGRSGCVVDCHATTKVSIPGGDGVKTELHVLRKGQLMGLPSLNDLNADGTLTQPTNQPKDVVSKGLANRTKSG